MNFLRSLLVGTVAGAVGTAALNIATYGDMLWRGRPPSDIPGQFVKKLAQADGIAPLAADDDAANNRRSGAGALLGYANGLAVGAVYGAIRPALRGKVPLLLAGIVAGGTAMALSDVPLTKAGLTDPTTWKPVDWAADIIPHACYGLALALAFDGLTGDVPGAR